MKPGDLVECTRPHRAERGILLDLKEIRAKHFANRGGMIEVADVLLFDKGTVVRYPTHHLRKLKSASRRSG